MGGRRGEINSAKKKKQEKKRSVTQKCLASKKFT
jgi:hypothetical protein